MRLHYVALATALSLSAPAALSAQTTSSTSGTDQTTTATQTTTGTDQTATATQTTTTTTSTTNVSTSYSDHPSRWMGSAYVGANTSNNSASMPGGVSVASAAATPAGGMTTDTSSKSAVDFGINLGYLWHSIAGAEFDAGFTPNFNMANSYLASGVTPNVNTYMINAIGSYPLGGDGNIQPYISGGFGAITLRGATAAAGLTSTGTTSGTTSSSATGAVTNMFSPDESHSGGDIGFGLMAFMGSWGVRGDVRYFTAFGSSSSSTSTSTTTTTGTTTTGTSTGAAGTTVASGSSGTVISGLLPGLSFWRANIGLAFRW